MGLYWFRKIRGDSPKGGTKLEQSRQRKGRKNFPSRGTRMHRCPLPPTHDRGTLSNQPNHGNCKVPKAAGAYEGRAPRLSCLLCFLSGGVLRGASRPGSFLRLKSEHMDALFPEESEQQLFFPSQPREGIKLKSEWVQGAAQTHQHSGFQMLLFCKLFRYLFVKQNIFPLSQ